MNKSRKPNFMVVNKGKAPVDRMATIISAMLIFSAVLIFNAVLIFSAVLPC